MLWIVGFFIAKRMPKGALIQIRLNPDKPKFLINVSSILVNNDKSSIIKWHLQRLIPFMEFKNQDAISGFGVTLEVIDGEIYRNGELLGKGEVLDKEQVGIKLKKAYENLSVELDRFIDNTIDYAKNIKLKRRLLKMARYVAIVWFKNGTKKEAVNRFFFIIPR